MPIRLCITGALGRMGRRLVALSHADATLEPTLAVDAKLDPAAPPTLPDWPPDGLTFAADTATLAKHRAQVDVVVDFTLPAALSGIVDACRATGTPLVSGTTGLGPAEEAWLDEAAGEIPVLHATNFSLGIALLTALTRQAARALGGDGDSAFDIEIIESHHTRKVDAPSGTAVTLAQAAAEALGWTYADVAQFGREGAVGPRPSREIGIHAVRAGDIVGEHTVLLAGPEERIELSHRAGSRDIFVRGALRAAAWLASQSPGRYGIADMLGLE